MSDGGASVYEETCADLQLVPCSIVLKSLPTTIIQVHNYGLGSAGTLALSQALKVNVYCKLAKFKLISFLLVKYNCCQT
jgi:hypothetical protein